MNKPALRTLPLILLALLSSGAASAQTLCPVSFDDDTDNGLITVDTSVPKTIPSSQQTGYALWFDYASQGLVSCPLGS